ncbi:23239_t:CDS:2 [Dentiscutata erythropus]|uniref:23239_t:CDS:1 n=1 Tax=Dentiscutata erythropus TaxID=1348616 RepID=A0A9N9HA78_9GLOM|nr:23239_t:CDS:2 [Dentiscutata erythropus]
MDSPFDSPENTPPRHSSIPTISTSSCTDPEPRQINRGFTLPTPGSPKRGYKKPAKPREFAKSAKKRQSVLALAMLDAWCMVTGEVKAEADPVPVDVLAAIETTTKALQSVKSYSMFKEDLSDDALTKIRATALEVLEMISNLEKEHRDDDTDDSSSEDGHIYKESNYRSLDSQREILKKYLLVVEDNLLFDDKDIYHNVSYLRTSTDEERNGNDAPITPPLSPGHPNSDWVDPDHFGARYHAFLEAHRPSKSKQAPGYTPLPDPSIDKTEFLASLALRRSKRPFGFIDKIHEDTSRTYRATENLKFFIAFRFDIKFDDINVTEVVKLTNTGKAHIFCEKAMQELISTGSYKQYPLSRVSSMYVHEAFSNSQIQLQKTKMAGVSSDDLASAVNAKLKKEANTIQGWWDIL